jgi:hypothetical protein
LLCLKSLSASLRGIASVCITLDTVYYSFLPYVPAGGTGMRRDLYYSGPALQPAWWWGRGFVMT